MCSVITIQSPVVIDCWYLKQNSPAITIDPAVTLAQAIFSGTQAVACFPNLVPVCPVHLQVGADQDSPPTRAIKRKMRLMQGLNKKEECEHE